MAVAVPVTFAEIHAILAPQGFVEVQVPGTRERVFSRFVTTGICQRVLTSVVGDTSRGVGEDAIRVVLVTKLANGEIKLIGVDKRVHRVEGWRANLGQRLDSWREQMGPTCPACNSPTVLKKTKRPFWGCCRYPVCQTYQDAAPKPAPAPYRPQTRFKPAVRFAPPVPQDEFDAEADLAMRERMEEKQAYARVEEEAERRAYLSKMDRDLAAVGAIDDDGPPAEWR